MKRTTALLLLLLVAPTTLFGARTLIQNSDVNPSAAIARSKMAAGTADHVVINDGSGVFSSEATLAVSRGGTGVATAATAPWVETAGDTMTGVLLMPDGAVGTPSLGFSGDTNTGFYRVGADQLGVTTGGALTATFNSTNSILNAGTLSLGGAYNTNAGSQDLQAIGASAIASMSEGGFLGTTPGGSYLWGLAGDSGGTAGLLMHGGGSNLSQMLLKSGTTVVGNTFNINSTAITAGADFVVQDKTAAASTKAVVQAGPTQGAVNLLEFQDNAASVNNGTLFSGIGPAGKIFAPLGTAALPGYYFLADPDTGLFSTADVLGFSTGGSQRAQLDSSGLTVSNLTTGVVLSSATGLLSNQALTDGQLIVGSTGNAPVAATLTAGAGISVTNGAGSITIATSGAGSPNVVTKTASATILTTENVVIAKTSGGAFTLTMPDCDASGDFQTEFKLIGWEPLTIATDSNDDIDEEFETIILTQSGRGVKLICEGGFYYAFYF